MPTFIIKAITRYEIEANTINEAKQYYLNGSWDSNDMIDDDGFELVYINDQDEYIDITPKE